MGDTVKLIGVGYLLLVASLVAEFVSSALLGVAGAVPPDPTGDAWLWAVTWMMLGAAPLVLGASYGLAYALMRPASATEGIPIGLVWAAIVGLTHLLIGLGNASLGMFLTLGTYVMLAACAAGPWLAGWVRERRTTVPRGRTPSR